MNIWPWRPLRIYRDALMLITREGCESFTSPPYCCDEGSGRARGAQYGAEQWCPACIARDALREA